MTEDQLLYHELEGLQELGLISGNLTEIYTEELRNKKVEIEEPYVELENHMVIGEYYSEESK